jgi:hypothetical protein
LVLFVVVGYLFSFNEMMKEKNVDSSMLLYTLKKKQH